MKQKTKTNQALHPLPVTPPLHPASNRDKIELLKIASITNKFDVRMELDQDRVLQFASMYQSGEVNLPPVEVVRISPEGETEDATEYAYIDGRHRGAARAYLNLPDVPAVVRDGSLRDDPAALYARALEANWGGAKPPTRADIAHTILRMLESGVSRTEISNILTFLPQGALRGYLADALSILSKRRIGKALDAISEGIGIAAAAQRNQVPLKTMEAIISGKKGKWGKSRSSESEYVNAYKSYVSKVLFSANTGISKKLSDALLRVSDGELSAAGAHTMIKAWQDHLRKTGLRIADWKTRLDHITNEQAKATGEQQTQVEPKQVPTPQIGPLRLKQLKRAGLKQTADENFEYAGTRMGQGFWDEELPKAIRASGEKRPRQLLEYFESQGKTFTFKQVEGALRRLKKRGMK